MTDDDRRLTERLRRYESSVPEAPIPPTVSFNRRPPWMAIAAIGAAAVLAGAVIAGNALNDQDVGEADPTPTASQNAEPTPSESPSPSATAEETAGTESPSAQPTTQPTSTPAPAPSVISGLAWQDGAASNVEGSVFRITAERGRFYALGSVPGTAAIWSSSDGSDWQRADLPFPSEWPPERGNDVYVHELASVGNRLVAIGTARINDYLEVVVWESTDGTTWREIDTGALRQDAFLVDDISDGPGGLVVLSQQYIPGNSSAWRSADGGGAWTEHRPPGEGLSLHAVVGTASGYVIAGAESDAPTDGQPSSPRIWHSTNGTNWTAASVEGSGGLGQVEQITVDGSGRWAAVGALNGSMVAWHSQDGRSWTVTADFGPLGNSYLADMRLAGAPDGFIAVHATQQAATWTSADGATWTLGSSGIPSVSDTGFGWSRGIGRIGDTVVMTGDAPAPEGWLSWIGTIQR